MKVFDAGWHWIGLRRPEFALVVGVAGGRVGFLPRAKYLYSVRLLLLVLKIEVLWTTGETGRVS